MQAKPGRLGQGQGRQTSHQGGLVQPKGYTYIGWNEPRKVLTRKQSKSYWLIESNSPD